MNTWSRDDLSRIGTPDPAHDSVVDGVLDTVVHWLNKHHPKPDPGAMSENYTPEGVDIVMRNLADARRERDAAVSRAERAEDQWKKWEHKANEWKARAEAAERELADEYSEANQKAAAWDRVAAHPTMRDLPDGRDGSYADMVFERITRLAETAEAVTEMTPASAVSRADVAEALGRCLNPEMWNVTFPSVVNEMCDLFGVEAEQAVDPVEAKARELYEHVYVGRFENGSSGVQAEYRKLAAHVLGQEADHA